ncbi:hypothetical protein HT031_001755 [Scenedesmus sp. PABB004]|nr:hypothetical protein HT031_001755 [Scenedesmus sp. PABB004]
MAARACALVLLLALAGRSSAGDVPGAPGAGSQGSETGAAPSAAAASAGPAAGAPSPAQALTPAPILEKFNLTAFYPMLGFDQRFDPGVMAAQGRAAIVPGASPLYNDYVTGFVGWIEAATPPYGTPKASTLPPLPAEYVPDVEWVASLKRGPYPDLLKTGVPNYAKP